MTTDRLEGPGGVEKLSSNVMNYLVWRYLQESGYGKTAKQLQYQWMGREQTPEHLPFAPNIKKSCLVHLAQDGLLLDQLQAEVKRTNRQYIFGSDHGRKFSVPAEETREKKARVRSTSRILSTSDGGQQNGNVAEPAAQKRGKGKRKSGGTEKRTNGDAMDVDAVAGTTSTNDSVVAEAESPMPLIEEVPLISTLEIGESKGTLTEQPRDLVPSTAFVDLEDGLLLEQVKWSPHNKTALATGGRNHFNIYKIPSSEPPVNGLYSKSTKVKVDSDECDIQAFTWTEKGSGAFTTLEKVQDESGGHSLIYKMIGFNDFGQTTRLVDLNAGWVLALKYNPESQLLLSLSWGEQSLVKIWDYSETIIENSKRRVEPSYELKLQRTMNSMLFEAVWTGPTRFMVCGRGTLDVYEVGEDIQLVKSLSTERNWAQLNFDDIYEVAVVLDETTQTLGVARLGDDSPTLSTETLPDKVTDLAFQPLDAKPTGEELAGKARTRIFATASDIGKIHIWNVLGGTLQCLQRLDMGWDATAQSIAFSPDGFLLAAAGYDMLKVWKTMEGTQPKCVWHVPHGKEERWKSEVGGEEEGQDRFVHKLGWDADGKRIAFGMNGQVAIIRL